MLLSIVFIFGLYHSTQAQTASITLDNQSLLRPPLSGAEPDVSPILVYGGNGFTLTASTTSTAEGGEAGIPFTRFDWILVTGLNGEGDGLSTGLPLASGAIPTISGAIGNQLTVTDLAPGFYTFSAFGQSEEEICASDPEAFTVFVLAPLVASITSNGLKEEYCADDLPTDATFTASAIFDTNIAWNSQSPYTGQNPTISDFKLLYQWYKVVEGTTFDPISATPIAGATEPTYMLAASDAEVGRWNYYVTATYEVKPAARYAGLLGGTTPTVVEVTPKPGKPTIEFVEN